MQLVEEGQKMKCENHQFILPMRSLHFRSVSKTVSIPEDLDHRCD
jgi:hypothetical protein